MSQPAAIDWQECLKLITPAGQQELVDFIRNFRTQHGPEWLVEIKHDYPNLCTVVNLVANHTADQAIAEIQKMFPFMPVKAIAGTQLRVLHERLREEIDKPR